MARILEDPPKDVGLEGVGGASLVTGIRVPETGRCRNFSSGLRTFLSVLQFSATWESCGRRG